MQRLSPRKACVNKKNEQIILEKLASLNPQKLQWYSLRLRGGTPKILYWKACTGRKRREQGTAVKQKRKNKSEQWKLGENAG